MKRSVYIASPSLCLSIIQKSKKTEDSSFLGYHQRLIGTCYIHFQGSPRKGSCKEMEDRWNSKAMGVMSVYRVLGYRWKMKNNENR